MKKKALRSIGVFSKMSEKSLESLESFAKLRHIEKNTILYYEGERLDSLYLLARGKVELYKIDKNNNELFLCYIDSQSQKNSLIDIFGSFESHEAYMNVRGVESSEIVVFDFKYLYPLILNNVEISNAFLFEFMKKIMVFNEFINLREAYDSTSRVAYFLQTRIDYFNSMQRQVIARELNVKLETLSRNLQKMLMQEIIAKDEHGHIYIKDSQALSMLYSDKCLYL